MNKNNYYLKGLLTFLGLLLLHTAVGQTYCTSAARNNGDSRCDNVKLVGNSTTIDNNSASGCAKYTDFTSVTPAELSAGQEYTVTITHGTCGWDYNRQSNAWIDFNQDGDFNDAGEQLKARPTSTRTAGYEHEITFTVPCNAVAGNTRMRVIVIEGTANNPCANNYGWGET
ncbi:MAG: GEVED domain-containing protein, partial [Bacteroidia bacterium]